MNWKRKPQEQGGTYMFSGQFLVTRSVHTQLSQSTIVAIYLDIQNFVKENNGADYFQTYENDHGEKLYFIDELNSEMINSGRFSTDDNICTLMFSWEY